jgi:VWFA-related protein
MGRLSAAVFGLLQLLAPLAGIELLSGSQDPPVFRTRTDLVTITATVTTARGDRIANLQKSDFTVVEEGEPQEIALFSSDEDTPISLAIVVDTSGSMEDKLDDVEDALQHVIERTRPDDQVFLIRFSDDTEPLGEYTGRDRRAFESALRRLDARGGTALHDAVIAGVAALADARHRKRTLLLVTDGNDTASRSSLRNARDAARSSELLLYALGIGHRAGRSFGHSVLGHEDRVDIGALRELAEPTGGRAFMLDDAHRDGVDLVDQAVSEIGIELRQQYSIGYYPQNPGKEGAFRRIRVTVRDRAMKVRAREGYRVTPLSAAQRPRSWR